MGALGVEGFAVKEVAGGSVSSPSFAVGAALVVEVFVVVIAVPPGCALLLLLLGCRCRSRCWCCLRCCAITRALLRLMVVSPLPLGFEVEEAS